ncbi:uncharacterized protein BO95DRAFT_443654 [Aspergillus brunneoviolaceus CBS 621.78]|uniref:Uncharacterized protein n=1 Tax=Aspergillus brunneoviolaceus CBS 621.78 TaxID=1450534 RepID=A0ACD1G6P8_9EURO|nr:hypothetical protein BO95DRAFT_443654 [Aspergillus brunneoviolaceus CBS 621.78]RAH44937.1 hypothetical protein BO95DRAFT_443654 [Aspergillus brunneoviolaceus CBS 621.78]
MSPSTSQRDASPPPARPSMIANGQACAALPRETIPADGCITWRAAPMTGPRGEQAEAGSLRSVPPPQS